MRQEDAPLSEADVSNLPPTGGERHPQQRPPEAGVSKAEGGLTFLKWPGFPPPFLGFKATLESLACPSKLTGGQREEELGKRQDR